MVNQLADSFFSQLQTYLDPARLGPLLAEFLVNMGIAVFIPALFYCLWRMVNVLILFRLRPFSWHPTPSLCMSPVREQTNKEAMDEQNPKGNRI